MSKVRTNDGYKDIEAVYAGNIPIDTIYDKNGNILFSAYNEVNGISPLSFKSKTNNSSTLKNYRIYGNTAGGGSVGDRTGNLFDSNINVISGYLSAEGILTPATELGQITFDYIPIISGTYTFTYTVPSAYNLWLGVCTYDESRTFQSRLVSEYSGSEYSCDATFTIPDTTKYIRISLRGFNKTPIIMLNSGSEALPYEPYGYKVPVKIEGKNLLQNTATTQTLGADDTHPGVTFTVNNDGSIIVNGSSGSTQMFKWEMDLIPVGTQIILSGCPAGGGNNKHKLDIRNASLQALAADSGNGATYTITGVEKYVLIRVAANYVCDNLTFYPMIRRAEIADGTYEPYHAPTTTNIYLPEQIKMVGDEAEHIDFKEQKQYRIRKNLLQNTATTQTINNITFTVNQDYSITCNGRAPENLTATLLIPCYLYANETYKLTGTPQNTNGQVQLDMRDASGILLRPLIYDNTGNGAIFSVSSSGEYKCGIRISPNYNCENITFYPMIRRAEIADGTYEPYITNTELDVTLPSISIPSGTNTLSAETEVKPSDIYLKGKIEKKPKIYYYSQDGQTLLYTESVLKGSNGIYSGTPTKTADPQYTYTFAGWSNSTGQTTATSDVRNNIQNDKNVYAAFSQTLNTYTVYFYNGETLLQTTPNVTYGGSATYSGTTPTKTGTSTKEYIFTGWSPSPTNISGNTSCYAQYAELTQTITDSWQEILESSTDGTYTSKYAVGDTKIIDLGTEGKVAMEIVGIDTDDLSDNSGKAPITWISKQLLKTSHRMNPAHQIGVEGTGTLGGWNKTEMRNYLKETIKPLIPSIVRNNISSVKKYTDCYNVSEKKVPNVLTSEDVWIPSIQEVFGNYSSESSGVYYSLAFPDNTSRIKSKVGGSAAWWWLRTAISNINFRSVYTDGSIIPSTAIYVSGIALGFCTGKLPIYTITYKSQDGQTTLHTENVIQGKNGTYNTTPIKASTAQYDYIFAGWSTSANSTTATPGATQNIQSDKVVYAAFTEVARTYTVYFYNEATLLETVQNVPYGGTATYTGSTPTKTNYTFTGWSPEPTNISGDTSCYAQFEAAIQGLITDSWETIASRAAAGTAQNYYSVGDCKAVTLNGTCGTLELNNVTLYVYILGFDHNSALEGNGITFGGFKTSPTPDGKDICLIDSHYNSNDTTGLKWFNMNHRKGSSNYGHNYGGWKGCDMRYDILGSTDTAPSGYGAIGTTSNVGYDASPTCAINPVANTLMSCLPSDLRSVMKPMTKYTDNVGNGSNVSGNVTTSIDYLPLLAEYEIFKKRTYANQYEQNKQAQYAYYADSNNSKIKYRHSSTGSAAYWWERSPHYGGSLNFCYVYGNGSASYDGAGYSYGVAPAFLV